MNLVAVLVVSCIAAPPTAAWEFEAERVTLDIVEHGFVVTGEYEFRLHEPAEPLAFLYPFPADTSLGVPELMEASIEGSSGRRALSLVEDNGCWRWLAEPEDGQRCTIRIVYRQAMRDGHATYVLTSARAWRRPIERAHLEVRVAKGSRCRITPPLSFAGVDGDRSVYRGVFLGFDPTEDLRVDLGE